MAKAKKKSVLKIILLSVLVVITVAAAVFLWLVSHYKSIMKEKIPLMISKATDSIYHISFQDINIDLYHHKMTLTNAHLWADTNQVNILRQQNRYSPNTTSEVTAPKLEATGIDWDNIISDKSLNVTNLVIYEPQWTMTTVKHHPDLTDLPGTKKKGSMIHRFAVDHIELIRPYFTYHYTGDRVKYVLWAIGGKTTVNDWAVDEDINKDTSTILYGTSGAVLPDSFILRNDGRVYVTKKPRIDFVTGPASVTLKNVHIDHLQDIEERSGNILEDYNFYFPSIELTHFNWKRLLHSDVLTATAVNAEEPNFNIRYVRNYFPKDRNRLGDYPHQILQRAIKANIGQLNIHNGKIKYTEPAKDNKEATIEFEALTGTLHNITNIDSQLVRDKNCVVKLHGKYMHKSEVSTTFNLDLADPKGQFTFDGSVNDLDGDDVTKQAAAFTLAQVTSFHMSHMDMHVSGNENHTTGKFTMLYQDLKISLFKFKSDDRKKANGPFSFLADALIIYPSNPMPGKPARTAGTSFARDLNKGFISTIWQNIYSGAEKTAVRDDHTLQLTGAQASNEDKDRPKKRGFFKRLFGKK